MLVPFVLNDRSIFLVNIPGRSLSRRILSCSHCSIHLRAFVMSGNQCRSLSTLVRDSSIIICSNRYLLRARTPENPQTFTAVLELDGTHQEQGIEEEIEDLFNVVGC